MGKESKKNILLIGDNNQDIANIKKAIDSLKIKYKLLLAHSNTEALSILMENAPGKSKQSPDMILLDLNMSKINGHEFLRIIQSYHTLKKIKVYLISASFEEYNKISFKNLLVSGFITKPLNFEAHDKKEGADVAKLKADLVS